MSNKVLCESCLYWVNCHKKNNKPNGFCLTMDLFTYTAKSKCKDYEEGRPTLVEEYDNYNYTGNNN